MSGGGWKCVEVGGSGWKVRGGGGRWVEVYARFSITHWRATVKFSSE